MAPWQVAKFAVHVFQPAPGTFKTGSKGVGWVVWG